MSKKEKKFIAKGLIAVNRENRPRLGAAAEAKEKTADSSLLRQCRRKCMISMRVFIIAAVIGLDFFCSGVYAGRAFNCRGSRHINTGLLHAVPEFDVSPVIDEVSAAVYDRSRDVVWTLGDSGTGAFLGRTALETGATDKIAVTGADNIDWEALIMDEEGFLWICDIGDNSAVRDHVSLYKVSPWQISEEKNTVAVNVQMDITYPDGPMDVEAAVYDSGSMYLIEKVPFQSSAYTFPRVVSVPAAAEDHVVLTAEPAGQIAAHRFITDAAVTPYGDVMLLTYSGICCCINWQGSRRFALPLKHFFFGQQESIAHVDNNRFLVGIESGKFFMITVPVLFFAF